jgi:hypothetical protein
MAVIVQKNEKCVVYFSCTPGDNGAWGGVMVKALRC